MSITVKLKPLNNRFKRLIHDFGNEWLVVNGPVSMICFDGEKGVTCSPTHNKSKLSNFRLKDIK